jgi:broad specificity phosphatase PhoE
MVEVRARVEKYLVEIAPRFAGKTAGMVTHSGIIRVVDSLCARQTLDEIWERVPPNGCVFMVKYSPSSGFSVLKHFSPMHETPSEVSAST